MRSFRRAHARREAKQARRTSVLARKGLLVAGSTLGAAGFLASGAQAAGTTYTVMTNGDGPAAACNGMNQCNTLRDAITAADADTTATDTNTIVFASPLTGGNTISLKDADGSLSLSGAAGLTITSPASAPITITNDSPSNNHELIVSNKPAMATTTISGFTLTGGGGMAGSADPGGALDFDAGGGSSKYVTPGLVLNNDTITDNASTSHDGGGGIYVDGESLTLTGTTVSNNTASAGDGGGIFAEGGLTISANSQIKNNTSALWGGGIFNTTNELEHSSIAGSTISGNTAVSGGGIAFLNPDFAGAVTLSNDTISGNKAVGSTGSSSGYQNGNAYGGGVLLFGGALHMTGSTVSGNTATPVTGKTDMGGGLMLEPKYPSSISNSTISGNSATDHAGGLGVQSFLAKYLTIARSGSVSVQGTTISGNQATNGAGVELSTLFPGSDVTIQGSTISGNSGGAASFGGGLLIDGGPKHTLPISTPPGSILTPPQSGGIDSAVRVLDSTISGNTATTGAGVSLGDAGEYQLFPTYGGDGSPGSVAIDNSTIAANTASGSGGGIYLGEYVAGSPSTIQSGGISLGSTVVAGNTAGGSANDLVRAAASTTGGFNSAFSLIQTPGSAPLTGSANITGKDPMLGALANNGGTTQTMLPGTTSPVIDQGKAFANLITDQAGNARTVVNSGFPQPNGGDGTDIGAVELPTSKVGPPPVSAGPTGPSGPSGPSGPAGAPTPTLSVTVNGGPLASASPPLVLAGASPFVCTVSTGALSACSVQVTVGGAAVASGAVTGSGASLTTTVQPTTAGAALLAKNPLGVAGSATVVGAATGSPQVTGPVELLSGPTITLPTGVRTTKLPAAVIAQLGSAAKLLASAKTVTCTAYTSQLPKKTAKPKKAKTSSDTAHIAKQGKKKKAKKPPTDAAITKAQATQACTTLATDGYTGTTTAVGAGHAQPVGSNSTAAGRKANERLVLSFTL